jgi:hypothetical protein
MLVVIGASGCAEQPGPPVRDEPPAADVEVVADEASGANAETDGALRLSRVVLGRLGAAEAVSQRAAVDKVTSDRGGDEVDGVDRPGCVDVPAPDPADAGAVFVRLRDCRGPFGAAAVSGVLRFAFDKTPGVPGLRVRVGVAPGEALTVQGAPVSEYELDATLSFPAAGAAAMAWQIAWAREAAGGGAVRARANFRTVIERQPFAVGGPRECSTTTGRASYEGGERALAFDVEGYRVCPRPLVPACPAGGSWSVTDLDASRSLLLRFTGEAAPEGPAGEVRTFLDVSEGDGRARRIAVRCGTR